MNRENRAVGVLLGLACGDALGRPVEFESASAIEQTHGTLTEMVGHGTWNQPAGTITDDTQQALCIARSLVEFGAWDPADVADRLLAWYRSGPFDIGIMTRDSLERLAAGDAWDEAGRTVWEHSQEGSNAGNGSVMRTAPIAIAFVDDPAHRERASRESSLITHADPRCTAGCAVLNHVIATLLDGGSDPLASALETVELSAEFEEALRPIAAGDSPPLQPTGYVVQTLQVALNDALAADAAEEAIVTAVNRGGDTDTIGAVAGTIAGARFGADALPERWLAAIDETDEVRRLSEALLEVTP